MVTAGIGDIFGATGSFSHELGRAFTHGVANGMIAGYTGGNMMQGFASGALGSAAGHAFQAVGGEFAKSMVGTVGFSALAGGIGAELTGGEFWRGAATGATIGLLNAGAHELNKYVERRMTYHTYKAKYGVENVGIQSGLGVEGGVNVYQDKQTGEWKLYVSATVPQTAVQMVEDVKFYGSAELYVNGSVSEIKAFTMPASYYSQSGSNPLGSTIFDLPETGNVNLKINAIYTFNAGGASGNQSKGIQLTIPIHK